MEMNGVAIKMMTRVSSEYECDGKGDGLGVTGWFGSVCALPGMILIENS